MSGVWRQAEDGFRLGLCDTGTNHTLFKPRIWRYRKILIIIFLLLLLLLLSLSSFHISSLCFACFFFFLSFSFSSTTSSSCCLALLPLFLHYFVPSLHLSKSCIHTLIYKIFGYITVHVISNYNERYLSCTPVDSATYKRIRKRPRTGILKVS